MQSLKSSNRQVGANRKLLTAYNRSLGIRCLWPFAYSFMDLGILETFSVGSVSA